ncbi:Transcription initiation factor TFIID subunit 13 [Imshaugia aleurites]|uniref:Transcription initiation factor TFIID subunit 13 n=1 Tax=Imshaugia aleurites TaxID=172621 RepID=A0A8H3EZY2_9LECA|nr:Transcription initiation factor TFIID subunit 13 [Imshaugia aleurites]
MILGQKRSRPGRKASMTDPEAHKANLLAKLTLIPDPPGTHNTAPHQSAVAASSAITEAAQHHDESNEGVEPAPLFKRVKFFFTSANIYSPGDTDTEAEIPDAYARIISSSSSSSNLNVNMTEVRARAARHKGQMNFEAEITQALYAYGDDKEPLAETVRILDEMATDFIIETCYSAAKSAEVCGRSKLKVDDFKWAIRGDQMLLGRVSELLAMDKHINTARKAFKTDEGREGLERGGRKKKGEGKEGEEKGAEKEEDKGKNAEVKVEEDLGDDLDDDDME